MARCGENIYKRKDGRWEGRYIKGRKPDGKPLFGSVYGKTRKEARDKLLPLKVFYNAVSREARNTAPFHDYLLTHLAGKQGHVKASSYDSYHRIVHNHILLGLGKFPMHQLTRQHVEEFLSNLRRAGQSDGSVLNIFRFLAGVTKQAARSGAMEKDVCAGITLPKPRRKKVSALTRTQQKAVEKAAMSTVQASGYSNGLDVLLALHTGLRLGEICALRWDDIDLDDEVIHVNHTLARLNLHGKTKTKTAIVMDTPKSESSQRDVPINALLLNLLRAKRQTVAGTFVIEGRGGGSVEPRVLQYRFERLLERTRLPHAGYHTLRHTFATRCAELNVDTATISGLLGHASIRTTEETYIHSLLEQRFAAVHKLEGLALVA